MTITASPQLTATEDVVVYSIHWGEHDEKDVRGPYTGKPGIDFSALAEEYRLQRYAAADAAKEDHCWPTENEFVNWMIDKDILTPIKTTHVSIEIDKSFDRAYLPTHWPECPECGAGRGEPEYGDVRRSLNRIVAFRRCTECRHDWDHHDEPNNENLPMLEDDGRDTAGGCVPFAIGKACGLAFRDVLDVCRKHGWTESNGMWPDQAVIAARELGHDLVPLDHFGIQAHSPPTLKQLASSISKGRNYIVGLNGHWLAVIAGQIIDNDTAGGMGRRVLIVYEARKRQAAAA